MIKKNAWGWIVVDKEQGMTSMSVTRRIRRLTQSKKVGHAGTLDPLATGVLPLAINQATALIPHLMTFEKQYLFTVEWGVSTNTDDCLGHITGTHPLRPTLQDIEKILPLFTGAITQTPPQFSAAKIKGVPAYCAARRGESVTLSSRSIFIARLIVTEHTHKATTFKVTCGTGTYVRSLARDMAHQLKTLGHVTKLHRSWVGPFDRGTPIATLLDSPCWQGHLLPPECVLSHVQKCCLCDDSVRNLWQGKMTSLPFTHPPLTRGPVVCYDSKNTLIAMGFFDTEQIKPIRCFIG